MLVPDSHLPFLLLFSSPLVWGQVIVLTWDFSVNAHILIECFWSLWVHLLEKSLHSHPLESTYWSFFGWMFLHLLLLWLRSWKWANAFILNFEWNNLLLRTFFLNWWILEHDLCEVSSWDLEIDWFPKWHLKVQVMEFFLLIIEWLKTWKIFGVAVLH